MLIVLRNALVAASPLAFRLALYIQFGLIEGDWLNDWLTYLPGWLQALVCNHLGLIDWGAPGDFPWEDVFSRWLAELCYWLTAIVG